jgi:hypothetical protein
MPNIRTVYLLDKASADAVRAATRNARSRLEPTLIEKGQYKGYYIVPVDVMGDPRYPKEVQALIGEAHLAKTLDHDELWELDRDPTADEVAQGPR